MTMTTDSTALAAEVRALRDTQQVIDALYRFAAGQDLKDREMFLSAFAPRHDHPQRVVRRRPVRAVRSGRLTHRQAADPGGGRSASSQRRRATDRGPGHGA